MVGNRAALEDGACCMGDPALIPLCTCMGIVTDRAAVECLKGLHRGLGFLLVVKGLALPMHCLDRVGLS